MIAVQVTSAPIDPAAILDGLTAEATTGAIVHFIGVMRAQAHGRALKEMWLEHYPGMCERCLQERAAALKRRFSLTHVVVHHRTGRIRPGEVIVCVAAAAAHRRDAFAGAEALMDYLKTEAPFWKKEVACDGESWWVRARASDEAARRRWEEQAAEAADKATDAPAHRTAGSR